MYEVRNKKGRARGGEYPENVSPASGPWSDRGGGRVVDGIRGTETVGEEDLRRAGVDCRLR